MRYTMAQNVCHKMLQCVPSVFYTKVFFDSNDLRALHCGPSGLIFCMQVHDTVMLDIESGKVKDFAKFEIGNLVMCTGGANCGRVGIVQHREKHKVCVFTQSRKHHLEGHECCYLCTCTTQCLSSSSQRAPAPACCICATCSTSSSKHLVLSVS